MQSDYEILTAHKIKAGNEIVHVHAHVSIYTDNKAYSTKHDTEEVYVM